VIKCNPDIIIVGTGNPGLMKVPEETKRFLQSKGIKLIIDNTKKACNTYNNLKDTEKVIATLHLTC
jgi:hypothetical protein